MSDKSSTWSIENGLKALVTTLLAMNMVGYSFIIPDMVGGNGYIDLPTKELFIRWLEANTFMPTIQFSYVPWDFDQEVRNVFATK
jgi:alpha-glucosidase (family GH31 glycosyl hydrolase)